MKDIANITVDAGKFQTKGLLQNQGIRFRTKIEKIENSIDTKNNNDFYLRWEGEDYLLGEGARYVNYDISKHKLEHKLSVYAACAKLLKDNHNRPINVIVLCPLSMYENQQIREEFRQFIVNNHRANFQLNGEHVSLNIQDVTIFAEAFGVPISNQNLFNGRTIGLLDIGGLNVNGAIFKNMKPISGTYFTENLGSLIIMEKIRKELNKEIPGANIQEYQMDGILKNGFYLGDREMSKDIIENLLFNHFKDIMQVAKANNWDTKGLDIVITGGGSLDIGVENIRKYIPQVKISNNPVWDSCLGGKMVGDMIYGQK